LSFQPKSEINPGVGAVVEDTEIVSGMARYLSKHKNVLGFAAQVLTPKSGSTRWFVGRHQPPGWAGTITYTRSGDATVQLPPPAPRQTASASGHYEETIEVDVSGQNFELPMPGTQETFISLKSRTRAHAEQSYSWKWHEDAGCDGEGCVPFPASDATYRESLSGDFAQELWVVALHLNQDGTYSIEPEFPTYVDMKGTFSETPSGRAGDVGAPSERVDDVISNTAAPNPVALKGSYTKAVGYAIHGQSGGGGAVIVPTTITVTWDLTKVAP